MPFDPNSTKSANDLKNSIQLLDTNSDHIHQNVSSSKYECKKKQTKNVTIIKNSNLDIHSFINTLAHNLFTTNAVFVLGMNE